MEQINDFIKQYPQAFTPEVGLAVLATPLISFFLYFIVPYLTSSLSRYPGPVAARFTRLWLARQSRYGVRSISVHEQHLKHGKFKFTLLF